MILLISYALININKFHKKTKKFTKAEKYSNRTRWESLHLIPSILNSHLNTLSKNNKTFSNSFKKWSFSLFAAGKLNEPLHFLLYNFIL